MIKKGTFIEVKVVDCYDNKKIVNVFLRGSCLNSCEMGEQAEVRTTTGHIVRGIVSKNNFFYNSLDTNAKNAQEILFIKEKK
ncbi:hypothetical protein ACJDU8_13155 [Clostridium sp. WILCCON 0269]|uniref:RNA-binding protein n=1 Tax=Candidatus Clostridium eludens TaxID=3381663 RepID=A0ABW8SL49_9CLOT